jgi:hypothetical protein
MYLSFYYGICLEIMNVNQTQFIIWVRKQYETVNAFIFFLHSAHNMIVFDRNLLPIVLF